MPKTLSKPTSATSATGQPSGGSKGDAQLVRQSNRWRDSYNPLRNLVIAHVVAILEAAERGAFAELQLTMRKVERRYPVLKALKSRRLAALEKLDWNIKTVSTLPAGATQAQADKQAEFLRSRYELIENLTDAIGFLVTPEFRGYAILQKHRFTEGENDGAVRELHWIPQDQFARDGQFGDFFYNKNSTFGVGLDSCPATLGEKNRIPSQFGVPPSGGSEFLREDFIIRECDAPIYEIALIAFVNWAMGRKDWAAFVEIFGLPKGVVIMPANIPAGKESEYQSAAEKVSDGVAGALPATSDIKFPTSSFRNNGPFKEWCDAQDSDVVLAGTGGLLTMLAIPQGIGSGSSEQHDDAFDDLAQSDARKINQTLQRDFDRLELAAQFPGQPALAYFELAAQDEEDATTFCTNVATLTGAGFKVSAEQITEKTGIELAETAEVDPQIPPINADETALDVNVPAQHGSNVAAAAAADVQATALNGAQVTALASLAEQVAQGLLPLSTVQQIAVAAFPIVPAATIAAIFGPLKNFTPDSPATAPQSAVAIREVRNRATRVRFIHNSAPTPNSQLPTADLAATLHETLLPVLKRLDAISRVDDAAIQQHMIEKLLRDFPAISEAIQADDSLAKKLSPQLSAALVQGLTAAPVTNRRILNGDVPGHEFHGNQYTEGAGGLSKDEASSLNAIHQTNPDLAKEHHDILIRKTGDERTRQGNVVKMTAEKLAPKPAKTNPFSRKQSFAPGAHARMADDAISKAEKTLKGGDVILKEGPEFKNPAHIISGIHNLPSRIDPKTSAKWDIILAQDNIVKLGKSGGTTHPDAIAANVKLNEFRTKHGLWD